MSIFSVISMAKEDEFIDRYNILNVLGNKFKRFITPHIPDYTSGIVKDIGLSEYKISGCRVCIPPLKCNHELLQKKIQNAVNRSKNLGSEVVVIDPSLNFDIQDDNYRIKISKGNLYPPFIFIEAIKKVAALMSIDFKRCNICIANASTTVGRIMTELLLSEVTYLTLCTDNKNSIMGRIDSYMIKSGMSPAVMSDYKKAMTACDILICTGNVNLREITSFINRKTLIANLTDEKIEIEKDVLIIDEVILKGEKEPVISGDGIDKNIFLTSRVWEGALLTLVDIDTVKLSTKNIMKLGEFSKKLGLKIWSVTKNSRIVDKETIYRYR